MDSSLDNVRVGVGVVIIRDGKILMGKRLSPLGFGTWGFPGGKLDKWESVTECAKREIFEETGLILNDNIKPIKWTEDSFPELDAHYITLFVSATIDSDQEARAMEPEKCEEWLWLHPSELNYKTLFSGVKETIRAMCVEGRGYISAD